MAGHRDGDMPDLAVAHPWIMSKRDVAFLVGGDNGGRHRDIAPQDLAFTQAFRHQDFAVWLCELHHEAQLFSRRDCRTFGQAGLHGGDGGLGQVDPHSQLDLYRRASIQRKERGHHQADRGGHADQT